VERIVADIDSIVKQMRFPGGQGTAQSEREVKQALRHALLKYKLHTNLDLFRQGLRLSEEIRVYTMEKGI